MPREERTLNGYDEVIASYDREAPALAERYDALPDGASLTEFSAFLPSAGLALDVGAGSGRDARWLERRGLEVVAMEPAPAFRSIGTSAGGTIRWIDDRLPSLDRVHALAVAFDLITLSAVWQHVAPGDRPRALRKLATLMRPGGILLVTLRNGPAPAERPMHPTSSAEIEGLARTNGLEVVKVDASADLQGRRDVTWTTVVLRMPDDGAGALPLVRGIALGDDKSSTYKLGLLRAVARVAEQSPAAALPSRDGSDSVEVPLGLVSLNWLRMYLPLVRLGLPQAPRNSGPDGLGFAKAGFRALASDGTDAQELRVGAVFDGPRAAAIASALGEAAATIATMPANFTRYPNSDTRVFGAARSRPARAATLDLSLERLRGWGHLSVPGHLWRALSRYGPWIEPMLVAEWARLTRAYAERMSLPVGPGVAEVALEWREPVRTTSIARLAAERLATAAVGLECVWTGRRLRMASLDIDHCLPWSAWPCGDLWNLAPCDRRVNQHEKRDRLPSARTVAESRERLVGWWRTAYLGDDALRGRFIREVGAALPVADPTDAAEVYAAFDWRRLRLSQDQRLPEWTPTA